MSADPISLAKGQVLGRYELLAPIARGGMGQVWVARLRGARGFQKLVAIKTVLAARDDAGRLEGMLLEEARLAALIQHSNVAQTLELGEHEGTLYLVMEWIDGEPLSFLLTCADQRGGMPLAIAVNLIAQTLRGLHAAHELVDDAGALLGVVHRDVSPHNVLVTYDGIAKLVDFGIAKAINQRSSSTQTGEIKGKFSYMSPEQILGEAIDRRADIFSVGIMLYTLTTGRHPFKNHSSAGVLHSITSPEPAVRPSVRKPGYSRTLEAVVLKALEKSPENRWSSAEEMRLALQRAVPQAFTVGVEAQLRAYVAELVGDRPALKREALRQAELSVNVSGDASASLRVVAPTAQSASSLRAVAVDTADRELARRSHAPTLPAPPPETGAATGAASRWTRRQSATLAFGVAAAIALGVVSLHHSTRSSSTTTSRSSGMVELPPRAAASQPPATPVATGSVVARSDPSGAAALPSASALPVSSGAPLHAQRRVAPKIASSPVKPRSAPPKDGDLMAPDYAR